MSVPSSTSVRLRQALVLTLLPLLPIAGRLIQLQVLRHSHLKALEDREVNRTLDEILPRGRILDRNGRILTESLPAASLYAEPRLLERPWSVADTLAPIVAMTRGALLQTLKSRAGFVWIARRLPFQKAQEVSALKIPGLGLAPEEERGYPDGNLARNILGEVGLDGVGLSGIEQAFQKELNGENREWSLVTDARGRTVFRRSQKPLQPPRDIPLTVDLTMQYFAEAEAHATLLKHHAKRVMIIAQDPRTGEILAMAEDPQSSLRNSLVQDVFEPGSTFKIVAMTGVLEEHAVKLDERINCEHGRWEQSPRVFIRDHEPEGLLTPQEILEQSSNIGMAKLVEKLGPVKDYLYVKKYGFGLKTGLPLPGESGGLVHPPDRISRVLLGQMAFGQGVGVTAVQLVSAYSAIANGGLLMEPLLLKGTPPTQVRRVASPETIGRLLSFLEGVVAEGTGTAAQIPGVSVAGKTGTAQKIDPLTGKYSHGRYMSSFCGFAPSRDPKFTLCVLVDEPQGEYYGSETAIPAFSRLARQFLTLDGEPPPFVPPAPLAPVSPMRIALSRLKKF